MFAGKLLKQNKLEFFSDYYKRVLKLRERLKKSKVAKKEATGKMEMHFLIYIFLARKY